MPRIDMKINAISPNGQKTTTSITYINPEVSNSTLLDFSKRLNNLTNNEYESTEKIVTTQIDTETE